MAGQGEHKEDETKLGEGEQAPSFEQSAEQLSTIVQRLESGELPLEESLELFEEGVRVARSAQARLDQAEKRVDELLGIDEHGEQRTRPFGDG
jgi:exodeoxyribonuclease VII small subunit